MGEGRYRGEERIIEIKKRKIENRKLKNKKKKEKRKKTGAVLNIILLFIFIILFYLFPAQQLMIENDPPPLLGWGSIQPPH